MNCKLLYEDNHIIVAVKPANCPVQGDSSGDTDMLTLLKDYIKVKYNKPGNVYLGLVHRLDRPVGGVMVFARTSKAASRLTESFKKHTTEKRYAAVVSGKAKLRDSLECYMKKDEVTFSSHICDKNESGAKQAKLGYTRVSVKNSLSLLDISLETGRHHQIRVQLAGEGMPIYGDHRYNRAFIEDNSCDIALFAYALSIEHPITHEIMRFSVAPQGGVWDLFGQELACMRENALPVYIDENIAVFDKERGVSVAAADGGSDTLEERAGRALSCAKPVHRIDATTEGLVMLARNDAAYNELTSAFSRKDGEYIHKLYTCSVLGHMPKKTATLRAYLKKDGEGSFVRVYDTPTSGAKEIITEYTCISEKYRDGVCISELEVHLITGRTHQIRAHLAHIGHPLLGDDKYGDRDINKKLHAKNVALRSSRLTFDFPEGSLLRYLNGTVIGD